MSAPTPFPVPRQRDSSGLDAAVAARSMHPSIPWTPGDGQKHGRATSEVDASTRCGLPGPLELAPRTAGCCGDCFPPPVARPDDERFTEFPSRGTQWGTYLRHVHFADTAPVAEREDLPPVAWCTTVYFNGVYVSGSTRRLPSRPVSVTFGPGQEPRLTISAHAKDVTLDGNRVTFLGWPVLVPPFDVYDLPAQLAKAAPDDVVELVLLVAKVTVGGLPPETE